MEDQVSRFQENQNSEIEQGLLQWFTPKDESHHFPSIEKGMRYEKEMLFRAQGISLIQCMGSRLELPAYTIATAATLLHRFYTRQTFYDYKVTKIAPACLYVACKSDESSRRPHDIAKLWLYGPDHSPSERKIDTFVADLLHYELIVLEVTCFDLQIDHPYYELFEFSDEIEVPSQVANVALGFINDSFRLPLCIWYEPKLIAAAALIIGYSTQKIQFPTDIDTYWGEYVDDNYELIEEVITSIMEVYKITKKAPVENGAKR